MKLNKEIKVLVVDDSIMYREILERCISIDPSIKVVAKAADPFEARDKIIKYQPDVITLDIEMPKMNGLEFLRRLMPQYPIPVVVISSLSSSVFDALNSGAVDFLTKPDMNSPQGLESFINDLIIKIKIASTANLASRQNNSAASRFINNNRSNLSHKIIALGASTGGTEAIYNIIKSLPRNIPGIVIGQHMPIGFTKMFAERLNNSTLLEVREAKSGDLIKTGYVFIAPGEQHMIVKKRGQELVIDCFKGEKINGHCPSIDVLFESVAKQVGANSIGVILTGMGYDGAKGLLAMRKQGARTIGQDEKSSIVYGMPKVAFSLGAVEKQAALKNIAPTIISLLNGE